MHVEQDANGNFYIVDEPMVVTGEDAERILAKMSEPPTPEQVASQAECVARYERTMAKLNGGDPGLTPQYWAGLMRAIEMAPIVEDDGEDDVEPIL